MDYNQSMNKGTKILEGVDKEQEKAITFGNGPLLIIAGAGTGKTTVITRRIGWLIEQRLESMEAVDVAEKGINEESHPVKEETAVGEGDLNQIEDAFKIPDAAEEIIHLEEDEEKGKEDDILFDTPAEKDKDATVSSEENSNLAKDVDSKLLALYVNLGQSVGTDATDITAATFLSAIQYLDLADAPETNRSAVFTAGQKAAFLNVDQFVRYDSTGIGGQMNPIIRGQFGELYGVDVYFTTNVTTTGSPAGDHNLMFHKEAFALAMQRDIRIQSQYDIDALATKAVGDVLYGVSEYRDTFGVVIKT